MAVQDGSIHDVATKVGRGTNKNWDVPPAAASSRHWTYDAIGWTDVHRKSVKVKVNTFMYGQFSLATCLSSHSLQQQESQTYCYIDNCWGLWLYGYN